MQPKPSRPTLPRQKCVMEDVNRRLFGANLRDARIAEGMLQIEVARAMGINRQSKVSDIENGKVNLTLRTMSLLAQAVKRDLRILLDNPAKI